MQFIFKCASDINKWSINSMFPQIRSLPFTSSRLGSRIIIQCCCHQIIIVSRRRICFVFTFKIVDHYQIVQKLFTQKQLLLPLSPLRECPKILTCPETDLFGINVAAWCKMRYNQRQNRIRIRYFQIMKISGI